MTEPRELHLSEGRLWRVLKEYLSEPLTRRAIEKLRDEPQDEYDLRTTPEEQREIDEEIVRKMKRKIAV